MSFPFFSLLPELTLLTGLLLLLLIPFFIPRSIEGVQEDQTCGGKIAYIITQVSLWLAILFLCLQDVESTRLAMQTLLLRSMLTQMLQVVALAATSVALFYAYGYLIHERLLKTETFILLFCTLLGVMTVIGATHFIPVYLGIELMSLPLYAMVALRKEHLTSAEASLKYFFLGALASSFLLYGFSLIYGATGSLSMLEIGRQAISGNATLLKIGLLFVVAGLAFKLSIVPFHMWAPDVYRGAPTFVTAFISTVSKLAIVILLLRLMSGPLVSLMTYWQSILVVLACLSMILGATVAILQTNIKRMLAYSTIGHMGYLLLGAMTGDLAGYSASLFYVFVYAITNLVAFGVLLSMHVDEKENDNLDDFRGLYYRSPLRALLMGMAMFSLAGIPPFIGFFGKFAVIEIAFNNGFFWTSIIAILTSVIAAFYYLRIVLLMFFTESAMSATRYFTRAPWSMSLLTINGLTLIVLGLFPSLILSRLVYAIARVIVI
ncbi:MAG: NADH-quinone oxidoreductase subunit N [Burkholderiales bacterium]|nr:NADH-quinone oxidoreductase subunit N [Burkholderiales bacterium]